ncbi:MAG: uroporphyrinogen decarboxylase family protein [Anaerolineae bacterium]
MATTTTECVLKALRGQTPDRIPFVSRLDVWYACHQRAGSIPSEFHDMSLDEIHCALGVGRQRFMVPFRWRLRRVEISVTFHDTEIFREYEPLVELISGTHDWVRNDQAGETVTYYRTPVGSLRTRHNLSLLGVQSGTEPYLEEHFIKEDGDYHVVEYMWEHAEYVPVYDTILQEQRRLEGFGFVIPLLPRIPFQQALLEYLGEVPLFYALHDNPSQVERLLQLLDEQLMDILHHLAELPALYVEFPDNLHGLMTNPSLFRKYCLPAYQRYCDVLHRQDKKVGSHTDGDVKPLLKLLKDSGLDVCESFSPAPLTSCTFDEAWNVWQGKPMIWGGIPSPLLEERTDERMLHEYLEHLLAVVGQQPIILSVVDMVMGHNSVERIRTIAKRLEEHVLSAEEVTLTPPRATEQREI